MGESASQAAAAALIAYPGSFQARGWRKALVFCNTRAEVEAEIESILGHLQERQYLSARRDEAVPARLPYLSARQLLSFSLAQSLGEHLGFARGTAPLVETAQGWLLFHWLGDVYGQALLDLLRPLLAVEESAQPA